VEFAKKANVVGPWIKDHEEKLRSIALKMQGPLEVCELAFPVQNVFLRWQNILFYFVE